MYQDNHSCMDVEDNDTPEEALFDAVRRNNLDGASFMLSSCGPDACPDVNKLNNTQKSCLYMALENENIPMVKLLIDHGANINLSSFSNTFSRYESPLVTAVRLENDELIDILMGKGCCMEGQSQSGREEKTALQWAATYGNLHLAGRLLKQGADINWIGPYFHTALHYATIADKPDMVEWLLEHGADITINGDGRSPLHIAAVRGNLPIVRHLLKYKCEVNSNDNFRFTPFSLASLRGHIGVLTFLLKHPPEDGFDVDDGLHRAAESGHVEVIKLLLGQNANPNALNPIGESPLSTAARAGQLGPVKLLLEHKSFINVVDSRGYTPLQLSLLREQIDVSILLVQHGAALHSLSKNTDSPLHLAVTTSNPLLVKCIMQAGCKLHEEPWFTDKQAFDKLQDLEFMCPGPQRFRRESDHQKETWRWIISQLKKPLSLCQMTRVVIREQMLKASKGTSILLRIDELPVPAAHKSFVALDDVLME